MNFKDFPDKPLLDRLLSLKIEKVQHGSDFIAVAPTWLISEKVTLEDFLSDFADPKKAVDALRDFACMPAASIRPYFKVPSILYSNADSSRVCPLNEDLTVNPKFYPLSGVNYYIANDLSVSRDSTGVAMIHRIFFEGKDVYVLDFSLQVKASHVETIDYDSLRNVVRTLKRRGFSVKKLGYDQFQSHDSAIIMAKEGYDVEIVKYHDSLAGCGFVWDLVHQKSLVYGLCDSVFIGEAGELQVINNKRIDHMMNGGVYNSKDCWDAVVNACVLASQDKLVQFSPEYLS